MKSAIGSDRQAASRVQKVMAVLLPFAALLLLAACPSKTKKESTAPDEREARSGEGRPGSPEDSDPEGGLPGLVLPEAGGQVPESGTGGAGEDGSGSRGPEIKPPGLDLPPAEKKRRVAAHLARAKSALSGSGMDPDEAIRQAKLALALDETSVEAMVALAHANLEKRYHDQALDVLEKALERGGSKTREVHFLLGVVHDHLEEPDKAFSAYRRAVALSPTYQSALMNLGVHYLRNQRYADAQAVYEKLTGELGYRSAAAWTNLGSAYRGRSAELAPTDVGARNQMILKAQATYKRAISVDRNYANAYYNLGLLYLDSDPFPGSDGNEMDSLRRLEQAKTYFDEYRRLPGADVQRVDEVAATAAKLISREERLRKKRKEIEERRKRLEQQEGG